MHGVQTLEELFGTLMEERPKLHGAHDGTTLLESAAFDWSLHPAVLRWLVAHVHPGLRTLETGCGYSTVVFALSGCRHDVVSPFPEEHQCINEWCRMHDASVETVTYHAGPSQRVLPGLKPAPLDLVLIDGDHAVPMPLIDYYYTADLLVQGGHLLVDDVQLRSVQQLCAFLDSEQERWRLAEQIDRTRIYRKRVEGRVIEGMLWRQQPYCAAPAAPPPPPRRGFVYRGLRKVKRALVG